MSRLLPLQPALGQMVFVRPPAGRQEMDPHRQPPSDLPFRPAAHCGGEGLLHDRLPTIRSGFMALDPDGTGLLRKEEFRRVLKSRLSVSQNQLDSLIDEVCERSSATVDYMQFLRRFSQTPTAHRACSRLSVRLRPHNTSMSLSEIQKLLRDKIRGNLRTVIRVLRLFDYNRGGNIQQHEFQRILDRYLIHLTDQEFQRLWNHYSPNNMATISYELFLDKLGFGNSHNFNIAPVCTKLEVSSRGTCPPEKVKERKQRPECIVPSVLPHRKLQTLFYDKMCMNSTPVWRALQAFDTNHCGLVRQEVLSAVLNSFIFPMNTHSFQKLTSRYGVKATGPVRWKHFLRHFMSPGKEEGDTNLHTDWISEQPYQDDFLQDIYPRLKEIFHQDRLSSVLAALKLCDPQRSGYVRQEDLQRVLSHYDKPVSDTHLHKPCTSLQSARADPDTCSILDIVFKRMRSQLNQRHTSLTDCMEAIVHSADGTLLEAEVRKILEDSLVILDDKNFNKFTELLGFRDGRMERAVFLEKYEEARDRQQSPQSAEVVTLLTSAEQCLASMKTRIKIIHQDNLTAFRLMDRKRKGVVDCHDFKALYNSLGFFCREEEYQRLLDLIGLQPGRNLNYAEFVNVVENNGKQGTQTATVHQQLHDLLACEARYKWADMCKVLCRFDTDGQGWIHKKSLRELLFTYALPLRAAEFEQLWLRYDPKGKGSVAVCDFLERLGFHRDGELSSRSQTPKVTVAQKDAGRPVSSDTASLECIELKVSMDDNNRKISYMDLLSVFNHKAEKKHKPPPSSPEDMCQIECLDGLSPDMALAKMQKLVTASAPNLYKLYVSDHLPVFPLLLSAFDQSSTVTVQCQVLFNRHMLTKLELNCENCTVNWKDFLTQFQSQSPVKSERCRSSEQGSKTTSPVQTAALQQIQEVSGHFTKQLMNLDNSNSSTISKEQFRQLCDRHCPGLTNNQFECVWSQMPMNEQAKLQSREFLKLFGAQGRTAHTEAERPTNNVPPPPPEPRETATESCCPNTAAAILQRTKSAPQCTSRHPASAGRPGTGSPLGSTERRLRAAVQRCWKEIQRNCSEEDAEQDGHISTVSFLEILQSLNINLSQVQFEHLAMKSDIMNNGRVSYHNFLSHFLLNLRPAETKQTFEPRKLLLPVSPTSQGLLSKDCVEVMLRIYEVIRSSWTSIRRSFLTSDPSRTGSVSVQDFRKVLRHFGVSLSGEDFFHLSSYFDANTAGKICYNNFLWVFLH